jgi:hypothetical protein
MVEAIWRSIASVDFQRTTPCYIPNRELFITTDVRALNPAIYIYVPPSKYMRTFRIHATKITKLLFSTTPSFFFQLTGWQQFRNWVENISRFISRSSRLWHHVEYTISIFSLKMEAVCSSETFVFAYHTTTWCLTPEDHNMNLYRCENLRRA